MITKIFSSREGLTWTRSYFFVCRSLSQYADDFRIALTTSDAAKVPVVVIVVVVVVVLLRNRVMM